MTAATKVRGPWAMPDAVQVLPADVDRLTWLAERRKGLGSSDASTVAGVNKYSTKYELYLDKTGRLADREVTRRMEVGTRIEPVLRQWFTDETGITVRRQGLVRSRACPIMQSSPDGLTDDGGVFEGKFTGLAEEWEDGQVPDHAEIQTQHTLGVTGRSHGWVVALIDGWDLDFIYRRVERNDGLIDLLATMEVEFWNRHILPDLEPPITAAADLNVVKHRYPTVEQGDVQVHPDLFREYANALANAKAAERAAVAEKKTLEAQLRNMIGDAGIALIGDQKVATLKTIERGGYVVEPTAFRQLRIIQPKGRK